MKKVSPIKRTIPVHVFNETEKNIIRENFQYKIVTAIVNDKAVKCLEFNEDAFDVIDNIESFMLFEAEMSNAEKRGLAMRISTVCFQCIRELNFISGANLIEIAKSLKSIGRCIALACVCGIATLDEGQARRLLPLVRAI